MAIPLAGRDRPPGMQHVAVDARSWEAMCSRVSEAEQALQMVLDLVEQVRENAMPRKDANERWVEVSARLDMLEQRRGAEGDGGAGSWRPPPLSVSETMAERELRGAVLALEVRTDGLEREAGATQREQSGAAETLSRRVEELEAAVARQPGPGPRHRLTVAGDGTSPVEAAAVQRRLLACEQALLASEEARHMAQQQAHHQHAAALSEPAMREALAELEERLRGADADSERRVEEVVAKGEERAGGAAQEAAAAAAAAASAVGALEAQLRAEQSRLEAAQERGAHTLEAAVAQREAAAAALVAELTGRLELQEVRGEAELR